MRIMYSNTHEYTSGLLLKVSSCHTHTQYHIGREYIYIDVTMTRPSPQLFHIYTCSKCAMSFIHFLGMLCFFLSRREEIKKIMSIHTTLAILFPTAHAYTHTHSTFTSHSLFQKSQNTFQYKRTLLRQCIQ